MTLYMSSMSLDLKRLHEWAQGSGVPMSDGDLGYAVHSALRAAFGELGPQPFSLHGLDGGAPLVYGYGAADAEALRTQRASFADPLLSAAFPEDSILTKVMPVGTFIAGQSLGFSVRVCPVIRQDAGNRDTSRETDAFIAASLSAPGTPVDRETVYRAWLARQIGRNGAAELIQTWMTGFRRVSVSRRDQGRKPRRGEKPDATFNGILRISDPAAFTHMLTRGVGRHRAFGFGMLLLRPPRHDPSC